MNRSALCVLLGLQLANCRGINETASNTWQLEWPSWAASNSTICTQEWESVADSPNLCKIYNWFGGLTNLFRKTGEVVSEFSPYYGNQIQDTADYVDSSVDGAIDYVAPLLEEHIPTVKIQISRILDGVPEVSDYLKARIDEVPDEYRAKIGDGIVSILEALPSTYIPKLRSGLEIGYVDEEIDGALRVLPSKKSMKGFLKVIDRLVQGDDWVPSAKERVQERLDDVLKIVDNITRDE